MIKSLAAIALIALFLAWNNVPKALTQEDRLYLSRYLALMPIEAQQLSEIPYDSLSYGQQLKLIQGIQRAVLSHNPPGRGIPEGKSRAPRQMYEHQSGLCFDRSYLIEKIAVFLHIPNRHISAFVSPDTRSKASLLLSKRAQSHALSELYTRKGWLLLDPDTLWIALDDQNQPVGAARLKADIRWQTPPPTQSRAYYNSKSLLIKGLYSRHGRFFAPFLPFPDVRWQEVIL